MDINKENENFASKEAEEVIPATPESEEISTQQITREGTETPVQEDVDCSTLSVDTEDIDRELTRYGLIDGEEMQAEDTESFADDTPVQSKCPVQKPIIIAAVAFLLTAVIVLGTIFVYKAFTKPAFIGSWSQSGEHNGSMYLTFEEDGIVSLDMGGFERYGTYTAERVEGYDVINTEFYELALISKKIVATYSEDKNTMNLYFLYEGADLSTLDLKTMPLESVAMGSIEFVKNSAPQFKVDPAEITHASADELGITSLEVDEDILGSWQLEIMGAQGKYETYTFNADGTGSRVTDYVYYETYGCGLGEDGTFKYTVFDGKILLTYDYYDGTTQDIEIDYSLNKGDLVLNGTGYEAVK